MNVNPESLKNLKPGANKKDAVRVTLTLKPETVKLLRMTGNMSAAVDKFIELIKQGCVQHDGMLNPLPRSEPEKLESQYTYSETDAIALPCQEETECPNCGFAHGPFQNSLCTYRDPSPRKPVYWTEVLTRREMIDRLFSAYKLDNTPYGTAIKDCYGRSWWKVPVSKDTEYLRPLGSRADTVWCR